MTQIALARFTMVKNGDDFETENDYGDCGDTEAMFRERLDHIDLYLLICRSQHGFNFCHCLQRS